MQWRMLRVLRNTTLSIADGREASQDSLMDLCRITDDDYYLLTRFG